MNINKTTAELVSKIEYIIGDECYNPNAYDGYTLEEGRAYRYPITIPTSSKKNSMTECKTRGFLLDNFYYSQGYYGIDDFKSAKYKFGSNHLYICLGIQKALSFLENRYGINFEEMEKELMKDQTDK